MKVHSNTAHAEQTCRHTHAHSRAANMKANTHATENPIAYYGSGCAAALHR